MVFVPVERRRPAPTLAELAEAKAPDPGGASAVLKVAKGDEIFRVRAGWPLDVKKARTAVSAALASSGAVLAGEPRLWYRDEEGLFRELLAEESIHEREQAAASSSSSAGPGAGGGGRAPALLPGCGGGGPPAQPIRLYVDPPGAPAAAAQSKASAAATVAATATAVTALGLAAAAHARAKPPAAEERAASEGSGGAAAGAAAAAREGVEAASSRLFQGWLGDGDDPEFRAALSASEELGRAVEASKAEASERLGRVLKLYEARLQPVEPDGNCQFRALSAQLYGEQAHHAALRQRVAQQLRERRERYEAYVQGSFDEYLERMQREGEWGDNVTLQAASDLLGCEIRVLTDQPGAGGVVEVQPLEPMTGARQRPLCLTFLTEVHYDSAEIS